MNNVVLTDYLPSVDEISNDTLANVRDRISTYLTTRYSDSIDMTPNSVFGDLILGPLAYLIASFEIAASRLFSDLDLANVASGQIYNCDFVKDYLENFGLSQRTTTPSTGVVQITFSAPGTYILDSGTVFVFDSGGDEYIFKMADVSDLLTIVTNLDGGEESATLKQLNRLDDESYVVNIPVIGIAGASVLKNTESKSNLSIAEIVSITSITDFDQGTLPENVMELANKSRNTYYAASLASRNGCLSFLMQTYPELQGVSPVVTGDTEMVRGTHNLFGVKQGVMDICIKSKKNFVTEYTTVPLAYNTQMNKWLGKFETPHGPPIKIANVQLSNSEFQPDAFEILSAADIEKYPNLAASYSDEEKLGIYVQDLNDSSLPPNGNPDAFEGSSDPVLTPSVINLSAEIGIVTLAGVFEGYPFVTAAKREIKIQFSEYSPDYKKISGFLIYGAEVVKVSFSQSGSTSNTYSYAVEEDVLYKRFLKGVSITVIVDATSGTLKDKLDLLIELDPGEVVFEVAPRATNFIVRYEYDPMVKSIGEFVANSDIKPINTDILVRNFLTCEVSNITVTYRSKAGSLVDLTSAKRDITNYINGLSHPNLYEEYAVAEILLYYGADGIKSVAQAGKFYRTVGTKYLNNDLASVEEGNLFIQEMALEYNDTYEVVTPIASSTLHPPTDVPGMGERNINYIISADSVVFDEVSF